MSATRSNDPLLGHDHHDHGADRVANVAVGRRETSTVETKPAFKTTEFVAYLGLLASLLITGLVSDDFGTSDVWRYATILTVGYMVARGLAKAGSYQKDHDPRS